MIGRCRGGRRPGARRLPGGRAGLRGVRVDRDGTREGACAAPGRTVRRAGRLPGGLRVPGRGAARRVRGDFQRRWFDAARADADLMIELFADPSKAAFHQANDHERLIARRKDVDDHPIPSGTVRRLRSAAPRGLPGEHEKSNKAIGVFRLAHKAAPRHPDASSICARWNPNSGKEVAGGAGQRPSGRGDAGAGAVRPDRGGSLGRVAPTWWWTGAPRARRPRADVRALTPVEGRPAGYVCEHLACRRAGGGAGRIREGPRLPTGPGRAQRTGRNLSISQGVTWTRYSSHSWRLISTKRLKVCSPRIRSTSSEWAAISIASPGSPEAPRSRASRAPPESGGRGSAPSARGARSHARFPRARRAACRRSTGTDCRPDPGSAARPGSPAPCRGGRAARGSAPSGCA